MTRFRDLVFIYVKASDGSGRQVASHVELMDAEVICQAFEERGFEVLIDIPAFGLGQNVVGWSAAGSGFGKTTAAPWREYLKVRAAVGSRREAFNLLYPNKSGEDKYGDRWDTWEGP